MSTVNLPTDLLRTFVAVCDVGGYTKAGELVGRTQPAISLQMRRLEELFGAKLIFQQGRQLKLTEAGELLLLYSRQILKLNDEAVAEFREPNKGEICIGIPTDYSAGYLQETILK
ncbi:MAG: LysR family transcriptional regulator, partial [Fimbriimonadaceae bacterium]|nr:LysR family transcriptional regulator [Alphaproteobacteria bacterium]